MFQNCDLFTFSKNPFSTDGSHSISSSIDEEALEMNDIGEEYMDSDYG